MRATLALRRSNTAWIQAPRLAAVGGIALAAALARASSYRVPIERDTGQLLYGGGLILDGDTPYVDGALNKGPAAYVLFAGLRLLSGRSEVALRLTLLAFVVIAALALGALVRRVAGSGAALLTGLAFALLAPLAAFQGDDPSLAQYAVAPMAAALALGSRPSKLAAAGAGAMVAFAGFMSPAFLIPLAPAVLILLRTQREAYWRRAGVAAGVAALVAVLFVAWLGASGALDDLKVQVPGIAETSSLLDDLKGQVPGTAETGSGPETGSRPDFFILRRLLSVPAQGLWAAGLVGCAVAARSRPLRLTATAAAAWIVLSWARLKLGDYAIGDMEYSHHAYPAIVGISLGIALGITALWTAAAPLSKVALAVLVLIAPVTSEVLTPQWEALKLPAQKRGVAGVDWGASYPLAAYIRKRTAPGDRVLVAGSNPELYWLADRRAPTRFFDVFPIYAHPSYAAEQSRALRRTPPQAIAALSSAPVEPDLQTFISQKYRLAFQVPQGRVWLRRPS